MQPQGEVGLRLCRRTSVRHATGCKPVVYYFIGEIMAEKKSSIISTGGKVIFEDTSSKAWNNFLEIFDVIVQKTHAKTVLVRFEAPDVKRGLLDAVPEEVMEKKFKINILEHMADVPIKAAREILGMARGFDIAARIEGIDMIFLHNGHLEILSDLQLAATISAMLQKMFRGARVK